MDNNKSIFKVMQYKFYSLLSNRFGLIVMIICIFITLNSLFQFFTILGYKNINDIEEEVNLYNFRDNIVGRSLESIYCSEPIDVVYTWVNGSDPSLLKEVAALKKSLRDPNMPECKEKQSPAKDNCFRDDNPTNRYVDNQELKYSLRSLEKYAPWIRHIYIVTNGQVPNWLDLSNPKVSIVTHKEIYSNTSHLPSFSSPSIESHLHRIPGLSRKFLYFNDDVMFGRPVYPDDFLTESGGQKVFLSWPVPNCNDGCPNNWIGDGFCDLACNVTTCDFDGGDCNNSTGQIKNRWWNRSGAMGQNNNAGGAGTNNAGGAGTFNSDKQKIYCSRGCPESWVGDKHCDRMCKNIECGFDAGDCGTEIMFKEMKGYNITTETELIEISEVVASLYFNLSTLIGNSTITDGSHDNSNIVRTATISQKYKIMTLVFHKNIAKQNVSISITYEGLDKKPIEKVFNITLSTKDLTNSTTSSESSSSTKKSNITNNSTNTINQNSNNNSNNNQTQINNGSSVKNTTLPTPNPTLTPPTQSSKEKDDEIKTLNTDDEMEDDLKDEHEDHLDIHNNNNNLEEEEKEKYNHNNNKNIQTEEEDDDQNEHILSTISPEDRDNMANDSPLFINEDENKGTGQRQLQSITIEDDQTEDDEEYGLIEEEKEEKESSSNINSILEKKKKDLNEYSRLEIEKELDKKYRINRETERFILEEGGIVYPWETEEIDDDYGHRSLGRKPLDVFGDSLKFVNRLYSIEFGSQTRKVPAHMPHMIDRDIMFEMQAKWPLQWAQTSSHQLRSPRDMQYAFSFFYYMIHKKIPFDIDNLWKTELDINRDGVMDLNELRSFAVVVYGVPLKATPWRELKGALYQSCMELQIQKQLIEQGISTDGLIKLEMAGNNEQSPAPIIDLNTTTSSVIPKTNYAQVKESERQHCSITLEVLKASNKTMEDAKKAYSKRTYYKTQMEGTDEVAFLMIANNDTIAEGKLDGIRQRRHKFICLNDNMDHSNETALASIKVVHDFYQSLFPFPSSFELPQGQQNTFLYMDQLITTKIEVKTRSHSSFYFIAIATVFLVIVLWRCKISTSFHNNNKKYKKSYKKNHHFVV